MVIQSIILLQLLQLLSQVSNYLSTNLVLIMRRWKMFCVPKLRYLTYIDRPCNSASRTFANTSIIPTSVCNHAIGRLIILDTTYKAVKAAEPPIAMTVYCPLLIWYVTPPPSIFPLGYTLYQKNWHLTKR